MHLKMVAARKGFADVVEVLIKAGSDVKKADYTGRDALTWAKESRNPRVAELLRQAGAR